MNNTFTAVDLSKMPPPELVEPLDIDAIISDLETDLVAELPGFIIDPANPAAKILRIFAAREVLLRKRINDAAKAVMIAYARGADLDNLGALLGVTRFELSPANPDLEIPAVMESDEDFRRRIVLAPEGYSVAGPEGAYIFHSLSANADVLDASAYSPEPDDIRQLVLDVLADEGAAAPIVNAMETALDNAIWPGQVIVTVLSREGDGTATPALMAEVDAYVGATTRRPLTDYVTVQSAEIINYSVVANVTTFSGPDGAVVMQHARDRLDAYVAESHRMGRDITISALHAALHAEGVQRVELIQPTADIVVDRTQAAYCTSITVTHAGLGE